jgi:hypothetical protein
MIGMATMLQHEVDDEMGAILSVDITKVIACTASEDSRFCRR